MEGPVTTINVPPAPKCSRSEILTPDFFRSLLDVSWRAATPFGVDFRRCLNNTATELACSGADSTVEDWDGDGTAGGWECFSKECKQASQMLLLLPAAYPSQGQDMQPIITEHGRIF